MCGRNGRDADRALAQGNVPQTTKWTPEGVVRSRRVYGELTASAGEVDIVVWPEAAIPDYLRRTQGFIEAQHRSPTDTSPASS